MSGANAIFAAYMSGERAPVAGPYTGIEALGLLSVQQTMLTALRALVAAPIGSGVQLLQQKIAAHHGAHLAIKLASDDGVTLESPRGTGFRAATPICANCTHEQRTRGDAHPADRRCALNGAPVMMSGTCLGHIYRPMVAKSLLVGCAP